MTYFRTAFNPLTGDLWTIEVDENDHAGTLINLTTGATLGRVEDWEHQAFSFAVGQHEPIVRGVYPDPPANALDQVVPSSLTSTSDYRFDSLQLDVAGSGTYAFIANDPDLDGRTYFLWDGASTPTEFWTTSIDGGFDVLRYNTAP